MKTKFRSSSRTKKPNRYTILHPNRS